MGVGWLTPRPGRFTRRTQSRCPLYRRLGGCEDRLGLGWKTSLPPGFDPRTVQPVASRYTDCDIPAHPTVPTLSQNQLIPSINDPTSPHNNLEERRTQMNNSGSLKSRMLYDYSKHTIMLDFAILDVLYSLYLVMT